MSFGQAHRHTEQAQRYAHRENCRRWSITPNYSTYGNMFVNNYIINIRFWFSYNSFQASRFILESYIAVLELLL